MKSIIVFFAFTSFVFGDVVLYDEPQNPNEGLYINVTQRKGPDLADSFIETCAFPKDALGNTLCYSGVACIEGRRTRDAVHQGSKISLKFANFGWIYTNEWTALSYYIHQLNVIAGRMNIHAFTGVTSQTDILNVNGMMARVGATPAEDYGLKHQDITNWQKITVPMSAWGNLPNIPINRFTWDPALALPNMKDWYIDRIVLEGTGTIHYPNPYPPASN